MAAHPSAATRSSQGTREHQDDFVEIRIRYSGTVVALCDGVTSTPDARECAIQAALAAADYLGALPRHRANAARYLHRLPGALSARLDSRVEHGDLAAGASTSLVAIALMDEACWVVSVGDSRAALIRAGEPRESTVPHNLAYQAWMDGLGAQEESRVELSRTLTRSVTAGSSEPSFDASFAVWPTLPGDVVVLTSDGVHEAISLREIGQIVAEMHSDSSEDLAEAILSAAMRASGSESDNATVCCILIEKKSRR